MDNKYADELRDRLDSVLKSRAESPDPNHKNGVLVSQAHLLALESTIDNVANLLDSLEEGLCLVADEDELVEANSEAFAAHALRHRQEQAKVMLRMLRGGS